MDTGKAIETIVSYETLPPQIEHIPLSFKRRFNEAHDHLKSLNKAEKDEAFDEIEKQVHKYQYETVYTDSDGVEYSAADMDSMF